MAISKTKENFITRISSILKHETSHLEPADIEQALERAVAEYSKYRPLVKYYDIDGDGSADAWDVPTDWEDGFSSILEVEYPQGEDPRETDLTEQFPWEIYYDQDALEWKFSMPEDIPATGETVRLKYTIRHTLDNDTNTIPDFDYFTVCDIAAEECCRILASVYVMAGDSTISADSVNYGSKSGDYRSLMKEYRKKWQDALGVTEEGPAAAGVISDWDISSGIDQADLLFHGRRSR